MEQMRCSISEFIEGQIPDTLQGLIWEERSIALQGPGKNHFGSMFCKPFQGKCCLCIQLLVQGIHMHNRRCKFQVANRPQDLNILEMGLQDKLNGGCCPLRIWRQSNSTNGLQELSKG